MSIVKNSWTAGPARAVEMTGWRRKFLCVLATGAVFALAACATGPVYKPKGPGDTVGYTDQQLTANRYRVTFSGNSTVKREAVEDYLLRRAAEVTLAAGYTHFVFDARDTKASTTYQSFNDGGPGYGGYYGRFGYGRFGRGFGRGFGRVPFYGPYWGGPWAGPGFDDITPVTRYNAYSEIVMLTPQQAMGNPEAISARDVLSHLAEPPGQSPALAPAQSPDQSMDGARAPPPAGRPPAPPPDASSSGAPHPGRSS